MTAVLLMAVAEARRHKSRERERERERERAMCREANDYPTVCVCTLFIRRLLSTIDNYT